MKHLLFIFCLAAGIRAHAQTDIDGLLMDKNLFCAGATYGKSSWKNYWEGTFKRDNANLGTVSSSMGAIMGNYGITNKLNVIFSLPYIKTKATAGQLAGQKGLQDLSVTAKWVAKQKMFKGGDLKLIAIGGYSLPVSNYTADLLPLSIGLKSKTLTARLMADYQKGNWFGTISGSYLYRNNVTLDRNTYYTTEIHYTNEVKMPDVSYFNIRAGYRSSTWIVEAIAEKWATLGGFDITKNNMPFVSNNMDATKIGMHIKYDTDFVNGLSFVADGFTTIAGRNMGQSSGFMAGAFYIMDFSKKKKEKAAEKK